MGVDTINLRSKTKGLRVCLEGGQMGEPIGKGRVAPVKVQPTFIVFQNGQATLEKDTPTGDGKSTIWEFFKQRAQERSPVPIKEWTRADVIASLKGWRGHGTEFWALEVETPSVKSGGRSPVTA